MKPEASPEADSDHRSSTSGLAENEDRLAWIFGSSRSGSTWLLRMLSELRGVVPIDDPHLGHHLGVWRPIPLAWGACEDPPELATLPEVMAGEPGYFFSESHRDSWWDPLRALIQARFRAQANGELDQLGTSPTYVVKEPGSQVAPLLAELFPSSKLVFLLRDGRDVVDSWLAAYQDGSWAIPKGAFSVAPEGRVALIKWLAAVWVFRCRAVQKAFDGRTSESRVLIRYEDLRERTVECLEQICEVLALDRSRLPEIVMRHRFDQIPEEARGLKQEIRIASPGSWQENLSLEEQEAMHEVLGETLEEFGYALERPESRMASIA